MGETDTTKITQQEDGRYPAGSRKHRQLVLKTMKVCAKSGDVRMLGKYLAQNDKLLQSSRRSHTLKRIHAFFLEGQSFENKHGIGAVMDLEDALVRQLISLDVFPSRMLLNANKVSRDPELVAPRWRDYGMKSEVSSPTP